MKTNWRAEGQKAEAKNRIIYILFLYLVSWRQQISPKTQNCHSQNKVNVTVLTFTPFYIHWAE